VDPVEAPGPEADDGVAAALDAPDAVAPVPVPDSPAGLVLVLGAATGTGAELPVGAVDATGGVATCADGAAADDDGALWLAPAPAPVGAGADVGAGELFAALADPPDSVAVPRDGGAVDCPPVEGEGKVAVPDCCSCVEGDEAAGLVA